MQSAILHYFKNFTDLKVTVNEMFLSEDGTRLAIQWDWTVTRKRDRKRVTTHDAILVHLVGGKITWNIPGLGRGDASAVAPLGAERAKMGAGTFWTISRITHWPCPGAEKAVLR
jgi:hypothetical protein